MSKLTKRQKVLQTLVTPDQAYKLAEAVKILKSVPKLKFDETVDVAINLNIDTKKSEQNVRGVVQLPAGTGKTVRIAVFAKGAKAEEATKAGADIVGAEDLAEQINAGQIAFDRCIATPDMMGVVGRVAKVLGPRGLMPNPKLGTVTLDVVEAIKAARSGQVEYRAEKAGVVHAGVGKLSFAEGDLVKNITALLQAIVRSRPTGIKGSFLTKVALSSTMGPGILIDMTEINTLSK